MVYQCSVCVKVSASLNSEELKVYGNWLLRREKMFFLKCVQKTMYYFYLQMLTIQPTFFFFLLRSGIGKPPQFSDEVPLTSSSLRQ